MAYTIEMTREYKFILNFYGMPTRSPTSKFRKVAGGRSSSASCKSDQAAVYALGSLLHYRALLALKKKKNTRFMAAAAAMILEEPLNSGDVHLQKSGCMACLRNLSCFIIVGKSKILIKMYRDCLIQTRMTTLIGHKKHIGVSVLNLVLVGGNSPYFEHCRVLLCFQPS